MVAETKLDLYDIPSLQLDENDNWIRPEYPRYKVEIAPPKPFLVPSFNNEVVEILPSVKQNRKINFDDHVYVMEIENRFQMLLPEDQIEEEDEVAYEIEIVEGGQTDDADFYLEMIDGEIFYVFETEDDISVEEENDESSEESTEDEDQSQAQPPMQLDIGGMMAPNLDESFRSQADDDNMYDPNEDDDDDDDTNVVNVDEKDNDLQNIAQPPVQLVFDIEDGTDKLVTVSAEPPKAETSQQPHLIEPETLSNQIEPQQKQKQEIDNTVVNIHGSTAAIGPDSAPISPIRQQTDPADMGSPQLSVRSILKACPPSPKIKSPKQPKKEKKSTKDPSKKKTFTKTYVRAGDFDGEHRVYAWEKPAWAANNTLRKSGLGDAILKGENLAQPITDKEKILKSGKVKWEKPEWAKNEEEGSGGTEDGAAKEELIRKIQEGGLNLPSKRKGGSRLKITLNGSTLRDGSDIVKPITKATVIKKPSNINTIANPKILRATPIGARIKEGVALEAPTTAATQLKKDLWEKPSWTQVKLQSTQGGDIIKKGGQLALPITPTTAEKNNISKEDWRSKRGLGRIASANGLLEDVGRKEYSWEKPSWAKGVQLRKTAQGNAVRSGEGDLARPITSLPHLSKATEDTTFSSSTAVAGNTNSGNTTTLATDISTSNSLVSTNEERRRSSSGSEIVTQNLDDKKQGALPPKPPRWRKRGEGGPPPVQRTKSSDL